MATMLEKRPLWDLSSGGSCKRKSEHVIEMSSLKKRRPNAKSYTVDIYEQPRSMRVSFLDQHEMPSSSSYIVGEKSKAQVRTDPSLLLSNFRGTIKLIWYLVADDVRYPHPYTLEGDDCVEGVCTKTIKAKGEVVSFPGLSIRKVSWKEMEQVLSKRVDRLKQLVPETEFRMKSLRDYDLRSVKICFQALPQDAVHDYSVILKPVTTRHIYSKDPVPLRDPRIMSISESKGTVHGKTEVTLLVSNLKTDDVLVFFYYASLHPRISWQAFAEILTITQTKHRQASILIDTPPFHDRGITEPKTVNVEIRLRDNSCSNTVKYTYTPTTQVVNRIQRRVKQKEPIFANYYSCMGAVTNVSPLVPTRELHQDDDKSTSDRDEIPKITGFDIKPRKQKPKTPAKKEDKIVQKSTSLSLPAGQSLQERKLGGLNSKEEIGEADGRVDLDRLSRYLSLTNINTPKESSPNGLPSHEMFIAASGASSCKTVTEENMMGKLSDFKPHSPPRENSQLLRAEGCHAQEMGFFEEENTTEVPDEDNYMDAASNTGKELEHTTCTISSTSLEIFSEHEDDWSKKPSEAANPIGKRVCDSISIDSGFSGLLVARSCISGVVIPTSISEQRCTSHALEDGKSMPTTQTTSPEAVNSTDDQQGAESNQNFGSSQHENESASKGVDREGYSHDNDEAEDDTFREELHPPRATQRIDHRGGKIGLTECDISLNIPPGALAEGQEEEIVLSVDWNDRHIPPLNSTDMNVAPIVNCYPTGLKFLKPVTLKIPHCAILPDPEKCKATVHCSQTDEEKEPDWERLPQGGSSDVQAECDVGYFHLHTRHFTSFTITVNKVETLGKEIMFVPFGKDIDSFLDDQVIRLYLYDFYGSNWERIQQNEKSLGGKMLDAPVPYQVLELYQGIVAVEMFHNTPGWMLNSDNKISFSFHTIWNIRSWNRCKFTWTNKTESMKFSCKIKVKQTQNDTELSLDIANHVKMSPKPTVQSSYSRQYSSMQQAPSGPMGIHFFDVHDNYFTGARSVDSGFTTNRMTAHAQVQQLALATDMPERIIKYSLNLKLCHLLDPENALGNDWRKLADIIGHENIIQLWTEYQRTKNSFSPTEKLLILIEQEQKICNLAGLKNLMEEINRPDAVDAVAKFQKQSHQPNPSSSTRPALTGGQEEQPMDTNNTPSPDDINQPLNGGGQPRYDFQLHNDGDGTSQSQLERNKLVQRGSCSPPTALSNQESTTPKRPYTDRTHLDNSTPSTNNNHQSNATCKKLDFDDSVEELQDGIEAFNL